MQTLDKLYPFVWPHVNGCPMPVMDRAILDAARELCTKGRVWKAFTDPVTCDGTQRIDFDPPVSQAEVVHARRASLDGKWLTVGSALNLPANWQDAPTTSDFELTHISLSECVIVPAPSVGAVLLIELVLRPTINATAIDDTLFYQWAELIGHGALGRLLHMSGDDVPWHNEREAMRRETLFESGLHGAANVEFRTSSRRVKKSLF